MDANDKQISGAEATSARSMSCAAPESPEINLIDYAFMLWRRKWLVAGCVVLGAALALVSHFVIAKKYQATTLVLPPQDGGGGLAAKLAGMAADLPIALPGVKRPSERYIDILKSRKVVDEVIEHFTLMKRWESKSHDGTRKKVASRTRVSITKGELISISVTDEDPAIAAQMANFLVEVLGRIDREIGVGKAGRQRRFMDTRLVEVEKDLKTAQNAWRAFQEKHKIVRVDEGLKATAMVIGELEAQRIAKEIQLQVMETVYSKTNPQVQVLRAEVKKLGEKLKELATKGLRSGTGGDDEESQWLFPAIEKVPALALEQMDLERKLRVQAALYKLLVTQRETARMEEARENTAIQVVSEAVAPDRPEGMGLVRKTVLFAAAGFIAAAAWSYLLFLLANRRAAEEQAHSSTA
jgi:uncharacterized protein involved in exopolysaccharide biosynthesis